MAFKKIFAPVRFPDPTMVTEEFFGKISSGQSDISIGHLRSAAGWSEAPQKPEFDEYTVVLKGALYLTAEDGTVTVCRANEGILVPKGTYVQYSSPEPDGAEKAEKEEKSPLPLILGAVGAAAVLGGVFALIFNRRKNGNGKIWLNWTTQ